MIMRRSISNLLINPKKKQTNKIKQYVQQRLTKKLSETKKMGGNNQRQNQRKIQSLNNNKKDVFANNQCYIS